jgi:hypothetical protein
MRVYAARVFPSLFRHRQSTSARAAAYPGTTYAPVAPANVALTPPIRRQGGSGYTWDLRAIRRARDAQIRGEFTEPVRMAEAMRTNDALFTAYQTRVAVQSAIRLLWCGAQTPRGELARARVERAILLPQHIRESIAGTMCNHGIAIGYNEHTVVDDPQYGPTIRMSLTEWPLEHVRYNPSAGTLETRTRDNGQVTIVHGDGRWTVFRKFGVAPWTQDACVLPGALVWAAHGGCISDWAGASASHGQPKVIGQLQAGVNLGSGTGGTLTPEAQAVLQIISALVSGDSVAGVLPAGAEAKLLYNGSTAWQVFKELGLDRGKAAMRIYTGTDATLGSQGGAPGVDIESLFGVASQRIQGDFEALERGFREGSTLPWASLHGLPEKDIPCAEYAMPDADGERKAGQESAAVTRLRTAVEDMKAAGLEVTQETVNVLCKVLNVSVTCTLAPEPDPKEPPADIPPAGAPTPGAPADAPAD